VSREFEIFEKYWGCKSSGRAAPV